MTPHAKRTGLLVAGAAALGLLWPFPGCAAPAELATPAPTSTVRVYTKAEQHTAFLAGFNGASRHDQEASCEAWWERPDWTLDTYLRSANRDAPIFDRANVSEFFDEVCADV